MILKALKTRTQGCKLAVFHFKFYDPRQFVLYPAMHDCKPRLGKSYLYNSYRILWLVSLSLS